MKLKIVRRVTQDNIGKKRAGVDHIKNLELNKTLGFNIRQYETGKYNIRKT